MEEEQKQDYREHLINTIDMLIDSGVSVYNIDVVNKKAIRYNYILKQKVKDKIEELKKDYEDSKDENGKTEYYYPDYTIRKLEELLEDKEDKP